MVDYYYGYVEVVALLESTRSLQIIQILITIFTRHSSPGEVRPDHGKRYYIDEIAQFEKVWGFQCSISSPQHSHAEGEVILASITCHQKKIKSTILILLRHLMLQLPNQELSRKWKKRADLSRKKNFDNVIIDRLDVVKEQL